MDFIGVYEEIDNLNVFIFFIEIIERRNILRLFALFSEAIHLNRKSN